MLACGNQHHRSAAEKVLWHTVPLQYSPTGKTVGEEEGGRRVRNWPSGWLAG